MNLKRNYLTGLIFLSGILLILANGCKNIIAAEPTGLKTEKKTDVNPAAGNLNVIHLTKEEFLQKVYNYEKNSDKWVYEGDKPCIVDFYADWCQPCKIAAPILEKLAGEYEDSIYIYKVDTQKERELAGAFGIRSIPTFLLCPVDGKPQLFSGIGQSEDETRTIFKNAIDEVLLNNKN